jgi:hypothetical protein
LLFFSILGATLDVKGGKMFGKMNVIPVLDLEKTATEVANCSEGAVAQLLDVTDHPKIERWVQFPKALFLFLVVPGDPESGAFYVYDRHAKVWWWLDFDDNKYGGYAASDFDRLVRECRFLDLVEHPYLLAAANQWIIEPGLPPQRSGKAATPSTQKAA